MNRDNSPEVQRWLRHEMTRVPYPATSRQIAWATAWSEEEIC